MPKSTKAARSLALSLCNSSEIFSGLSVALIKVTGHPSGGHIIPAATVLLLASSITMKLPVAWLRS